MFTFRKQHRCHHILRSLFLIFTCNMLWSTAGWSKVFENQYVRFELPAGWDCKIEGTEWVCQAADQDVRKEIIVICAAKQRGAEDDLTTYQSHLEKARPKENLKGEPYSSEVVWVNRRTIKGQEWVDALHIGSEIPGFYTRYLSTVKGKVAMLLTWSVAKSSYKKYLDEMNTFVNSLEALENVGAPSTSSTEATLGGNEPGVPGGTDANAGSPAAMLSNVMQGGHAMQILGGLILIAALGGIFYIRKRKKKKKH